ncbi:MAG TPA: hypothetical protein VF251_13955 [Pyrinomonadaceae bacterium]
MSENVEQRPAQPARSRPLIQRLMIYAGVLLIVFLLGLVPMWLKARAANNSLAEAEHQLTLAKMQNNIASAVIDTRRGEYEPARQASSQFFTSLSAELDKADGSNFTAAQKQSLQPLLAGRDEIITLLARSDPAAADRLTDLYVAYRKAVTG